MRTRPSLAALALAALLGLGACGVDNFGSIQLTQLCFPPDPGTGGSCSYAATCSPINASGQVWADLTYTGGTLDYPIEFTNQRADNSGDGLRTNTNNAMVERIDLRYVAAGGAQIGATSVAQSFLIPTTSAVPRQVQLIPAAFGAAMPLPSNPADVLIMVKAHGHYEDGVTFDTSEFEVPATLQRGGYTPPTCSTAGQFPYACPQLGQSSGSIKCQ